MLAPGVPTLRVSQIQRSSIYPLSFPSSFPSVVRSLALACASLGSLLAVTQYPQGKHMGIHSHKPSHFVLCSNVYRINLGSPTICTFFVNTYCNPDLVVVL